MALIIGPDLAYALDLEYAADPGTYDTVAEAADAVVGALLTVSAYTAEPIPCKEAALSVAVEMFQARTSAGGQAVATDYTPGPYRLSVWMTKRVHALIGPYMDVRGMIG